MTGEYFLPCKLGPMVHRKDRTTRAIEHQKSILQGVSNLSGPHLPPTRVRLLK